MKDAKSLLEQIKITLLIILWTQIATLFGLLIGLGVVNWVLLIFTNITLIAYIYYYNFDITKIENK